MCTVYYLTHFYHRENPLRKGKVKLTKEGLISHSVRQVHKGQQRSLVYVFV